MQLFRVTYVTDDVETTAAFYERLLERDPVVSEHSVVIFHVEGTEVIVHERYEADGDDLPAEDYLAFAVENLELQYAELVDAGFEPFREPAAYDWGRSAYLRDPDNRLVELAAK